MRRVPASWRITLWQWQWRAIEAVRMVARRRTVASVLDERVALGHVAPVVAGLIEHSVRVQAAYR